MPETKLTSKRLKEHFRKYWLIYIIGCAVTLVLADLLYTMTSPRTPEEKVVRFYIIDDYTDTAVFEPTEGRMLERFAQDGQDVLDVSFESINYKDMESDYYASMLLMVRIAGGDGDAYICNEDGYNYIIGSEVAQPLDEYLAEGWLAGRDIETVTFTNEETGESFISAIVIEHPEKMYEMGFFTDRMYVCIATNGTNFDTTKMAIEYLLDTLGE